jgi:hypothetical protein
MTTIATTVEDSMTMLRRNLLRMILLAPRLASPRI